MPDDGAPDPRDAVPNGADGDDPDRLFATARRDGVLRIERPGTEWLSTGWRGGRIDGGAVHNVTVPEGWDPDDVATYVDRRLRVAGFASDDVEGDDPAERSRDRGPTLLTGVAQRHARGARCGPVEAYATAGLSNPATLPPAPDGDPNPEGKGLPGGTSDTADFPDDPAGGEARPDGEGPAGTINVVVGTDRALDPGALANLVAVASEARALTALRRTGFPGTTTDAVVVGHDPDGEPTAFSGAATPVGAAARACVREAVTAALSSRYDGEDDAVPASVADARHGISTDVGAAVFEP